MRLLVFALPLVLLGACTGAPAGGTEPKVAGATELNVAGSTELKVAGAFGAEPAITFPAGEPSAELQVDQLVAGRGAVPARGDVVVVHYTAHVWDGRGNRPADSSFGRGGPVAFPVGGLLPGLDRALAGRRAGSRVIAAIPPREGFGANPPQGVRPGDDLVYVIDILGAHRKGASAGGPGGTLAGARVTGGRRPRLTLPGTRPPARYAARVLSEGDGRKTRPGELVVTQYEGAVWGQRRVFDSTWSSGTPKAFRIGDGSVIKAWDRALTGVRAGSRVLLVAPPSMAYGEAGQAAYGIGGGETLAFVVDVLASY
ncbi:FKBP-type peptidyl-prolyl cis-trans isomerase [Nonomuraea sp. NBC_01738]|uniref:FKBP-type peptidyl-prolyl cis-trans isomerase n=1 Tax=Nonomuraea sp. NBC_01738 TaxID=2976003 RepID=UPI002E14C2CD|nr:FKBP-type peptidyl-prolyl cis-trans isomerase [Nonomuraea sp. NBC_01738]